LVRTIDFGKRFLLSPSDFAYVLRVPLMCLRVLIDRISWGGSMRLRPSRFVFLFLVLAVSLEFRLHAQTTTSGGLAGIISDQSSAVVPNAEVELKDNAKGTNPHFTFRAYPSWRQILLTRQSGSNSARTADKSRRNAARHGTHTNVPCT